MKISDHISNLNAACKAIESAPEKGFINLDQVNEVLHNIKQYLEEITPRLDLGEKLSADYKACMLNKLKTLKVAGSVALVSQAEDALKSGALDYSQLKSLQEEIDNALASVFKGQTKSLTIAGSRAGSSVRKPEDYS